MKFADSFLPSDSSCLDFSNFRSQNSPRFTELEVFQQMKKLRSNSCGPDMISGRIFRRYAHELVLPLTKNFNCLERFYFHDIWKQANILPLPKGKSGYRPFSLLPCASKILERLFIRKVLLPSLKSDINLFQFGFTPTGCGGCSNTLTYIRLSILQHLALTNGYTRMLGCSLLILLKLSIVQAILPSFYPFRITFIAILWFSNLFTASFLIAGNVLFLPPVTLHLGLQFPAVFLKALF